MSAVLAPGLAYASSPKEDVRELLMPLISVDETNVHFSGGYDNDRGGKHVPHCQGWLHTEPSVWIARAAVEHAAVPSTAFSIRATLSLMSKHHFGRCRDDERGKHVPNCQGWLHTEPSVWIARATVECAAVPSTAFSIRATLSLMSKHPCGKCRQDGRGKPVPNCQGWLHTEPSVWTARAAVEHAAVPSTACSVCATLSLMIGHYLSGCDNDRGAKNKAHCQGWLRTEQNIRYGLLERL